MTANHGPGGNNRPDRRLSFRRPGHTPRSEASVPVEKRTTPCSWCGGSGIYVDPDTDESWPCIQCRGGRDGSDN